MKSNRHGQSRVLSTDELDLLISKLPEQHHQIVAEICRRTGCRIGEATQLTWGMVSESAVTFQRGITKGKLASRSVPVTPQLCEVLRSWRAAWVLRQGREPVDGDYLVPGRFAGSCLSTRSFMDALERAAAESGLEGVSSHSFRRAALTKRAQCWRAVEGPYGAVWAQIHVSPAAVSRSDACSTGGCRCCLCLTLEYLG